MNPVLTRTAMGVVVALAVAGALNYYHTVEQKDFRYQAPGRTHTIGTGPERFREVIAMLPAEAVVGYISDLPFVSDIQDSRPGQGPVWFLNFFEAQYALAPRLVIPHENSQREDWVLGNFFNPMDLAQIERENRVKLVRDFGSGVVVFRSW